MKPERFGRNLAEKSGTDRDLKWDEICSVLFRFLNWYGMFRPYRAKRNGIDNLGYTITLVSYELLFLVWARLCVQICMLELGSIFCVAPFIHYIFRKKAPIFISCGALFYSTKYIIWHCFLLCSCQCFNCLFHFKGFFIIVLF